jgi:hypothetical protein
MHRSTTSTGSKPNINKEKLENYWIDLPILKIG